MNQDDLTLQKDVAPTPASDASAAATPAAGAPTQTRRKLTLAEVEARLEPFPAEFRESVLAFRTRPTPDLLEQIVTGLLRHNVGEHFDRTYKEKGENTNLVEDLKMDSLSLVELSFQAEDCVDYVIELEDLKHIRTFGELTAFLKNRLFPDQNQAGATPVEVAAAPTPQLSLPPAT